MKRPLLIVLIIAIIITACAFFYFLIRHPLACYNNFCFALELAITSEKIETGLMFREKLEKNSGMLFIFPKEDVYAFWMKNTLIPLDIIWLDKNKTVLYISKNNQPCLPVQAGNELDCLIIDPGIFAKYVLELNAGAVEQIGLQEGVDMLFYGIIN